MNGKPVIRLEVESMKVAILNAFTQYQASVDEYVQRAVSEYCSEENLYQIIRTQAMESINKAIRDEVDTYFRVGPGHKAVQQAIENHLKELGEVVQDEQAEH